MDVNKVGNVEVVSTTVPASLLMSDNESCSKIDLVEDGVQCSILSDRFSIDKFMFEPSAIQYYTSFTSYDHFMLF